MEASSLAQFLQVWLFMTAGLLRSVCVQVYSKHLALNYDRETPEKIGGCAQEFDALELSISRYPKLP